VGEWPLYRVLGGRRAAGCAQVCTKAAGVDSGGPVAAVQRPRAENHTRQAAHAVRLALSHVSHVDIVPTWYVQHPDTVIVNWTMVPLRAVQQGWSLRVDCMRKEAVASVKVTLH
jgi:hypothetical protein